MRVPPDIDEPYAPDFDCPVTKPPTPGFQPPDDYSPPIYPDDVRSFTDSTGVRDIGPGRDGWVWFGTEDLWTLLPVDGDYHQRKSVWWSTAFPGGTEERQPEIHVTWKRLDLGDAVAQVFTTNGGRGTNAHTAENGWFMIAGIDPSGPGCYQVTAQYKGAELSYVYEIPATER